MVKDTAATANSSGKDDAKGNKCASIDSITAAALNEASLKRPNPTIDDDDEDDSPHESNQPNVHPTNQPPQPKQPKKRKHIDPAILKLRMEIHQCCKRNDMHTAWNLFQESRRNQVRIEAPVLYNLLSLCDGLGDRTLHIGSPRPSATNVSLNQVKEDQNRACCGNNDDHETKRTAEAKSNEQSSKQENDESTRNINNTHCPEAVSDQVRCDYATSIVEYMQNERQLAMTETAYTALTRLYSRAGKLDTAEQFLDAAERTQQCKVKLRLYSPVLTAYCERNDWMGALNIWLRLSSSSSSCSDRLTLTEREYASLLPAPYMERVLADLMEDVIVPSKQTVQVLRHCLLGTNQYGTTNDLTKPNEWRLDPMTNEMKIQLAQIPAPELQTTLILPKTEYGWIESTDCTIDRSNGVLLSGCMKGVALQAVTLNDEYVQNMLTMNERIVLTGRIDADSTPFQGGGKGKKRELKERDLKQRQRHWNSFRDYMAHAKETKQISVVIDGANVGYHEQNFKGSPKHVNYEQIDAVVRKFDPNTVLLVLHTRHCCPPIMPAFAKRYLDRWNHVLYQTPHGMNDDWFWLHAALETNAMVVTNDHMRDHHFQMVTPRSFLRWRDRHQIYFYLGGRNVNLTYPDPYSRRIQLVENGLIIPMPKKGDESRFLDGCFVADNAPEEEMYICFRPRRQEEL